ncbi:hypothetical protein DVH05_001971 [Phytophthora capsici]|nr:hypothetical protein DVH05_001971 [Phytophthora capsici]
MKVVEFLWQGEARGNQETISDSNVAKPKERRQTRDADGVLRYHVKMAHTWQPYLKR